MKILFIAGTRPEYIKLAPLYLEMQQSCARAVTERKQPYSLKWIISNQHSKQILSDLIELWGIKIDAEFNLVNEGLDLAELAAGLLKEANRLIKEEQPDLIIVQGDTLTALEVSRAAFFNRVALAHLEAGLRTNSIYAPYPEELSRRVISEVADYHFCPSIRAYETLIKEKKSSENIFLTGNTVIDALLIALKKMSLKANPEKYILVSSHRRENLENAMQANLIEAIKNILIKQREKALDKRVKFFICLHSNPRAREAFINLSLELCEEDREHIRLIEKTTYLEFIELMLNSLFIITDSGGVQEEAPYLSKQLLVLRELSEREEIIAPDQASLLVNNLDEMEKQIESLIELSLENYKEGNSRETLDRVLKQGFRDLAYGDGTAAKKIVDIFKKIHLF